MNEEHPTRTDGSRTLRRNAVGTWDLIFFVVAAAAPLSVMAGVSPLAIQFGGVGAPGGYLAGGIVFAIFAIGYCAMMRYVANAGAFYAYIAHGLGRAAGIGAALVALVSYNAIAFGFVAGIGVFANATFADVLGIDLPWTVWALVGLLAVGFLGYRRITVSARVLAVFLVLEVIVLLVLAVPVIVGGGRDGLSFESFEPASVLGPGAGALFVLSFGAFLGFESTAIYSEEARDRRRTVRRATFAAVGFLALFYALIVWTALMAFGPERALAEAADDPAGMFFTAMRQWVGTPASDVMSVLIVVSTFASTLAFHNASARYVFVLAREGVLPRGLGRANPRTGAPGAASLTLSVLAFVVVGAFTLFGARPYEQTFLWLNGVGIVGVIALQALCSVAVFAFFRRTPHDANLVERVVAPGLAAVALAAVVVLIVDNFDILTGAGAVVNALLLLPVPVAFAAGVVVALGLRRRDPASYRRLATLSVAEERA